MGLDGIHEDWGKITRGGGEKFAKVVGLGNAHVIYSATW
jgi:hypothetical protein